MMNVPQTQATLAKMPDAQLQQYAAMHKADPYMMSLAMTEFNRRKEMRAGAQAQGGAQPQPKVVDQEIASMGQAPEAAGIAQLPTPGVASMAGGGIVSFADGGDSGAYSAGYWEPEPGNDYGYKSKEKAAPAAKEEAPPRVFVKGQGWVDPETITQQFKGKDKDTSRVTLPSGYPATVSPTPLPPQKADDFDRGLMGIVSRANKGTPVQPQSLEEKDAEIRSAAEKDPQYQKYMEMLQGERGSKEEDRARAKQLAWLQAGLGTLAGTSQHAMVNIGAGGEKGIKTLMDVTKEDDAARRDNTKAQMGAMNAQREQYTRLSDQVARERIAQGQQDIAKEHLNLQALIAKQNKTPTEIQIIERSMRDPAFAAQYEKILGLRATLGYGPKGEAATHAAYLKTLLPGEKPTPEGYQDFLMAFGASGGGGGMPEGVTVKRVGP